MSFLRAVSTARGGGGGGRERESQKKIAAKELQPK